QSGQAVTLGIRPNELQPAQEGAIHLEVRAVEQLGSDSYLYGALSDGTRLTVHNPGQTLVREGERVPLSFGADAVHLFDTQTTLSLRDPV
ncbi:MAG: TOBE domain-containing protein, partial [Pseudomonadota bacterium]